MSRPATNGRRIEGRIPADLAEALRAYLHSDFEDGLPYGKLSEFLTTLIRDFFRQRTLDLGPFLGLGAGLFEVRGTPEALTVLEAKLKSEYPSIEWKETP